MRLLVVVDMQNDFTYDALRNEDAIAIIPAVEKKIASYDGEIVFTRDTHGEDYMDTQEGRKLPIVHCIKGTRGWEIVEPLEKLRLSKMCKTIDKPTFGSVELADYVAKQYELGKVDEVELIGVCTDICVISNAMLIKNFLPNLTVKIDASCCAGVSKESHDTALRAMASCQIEVEDTMYELQN